MTTSSFRQCPACTRSCYLSANYCAHCGAFLRPQERKLTVTEFSGPSHDDLAGKQGTYRVGIDPGDA
jgi:hypothetical protein